jgi:hypothetical protein
VLAMHDVTIGNDATVLATGTRFGPSTAAGTN